VLYGQKLADPALMRIRLNIVGPLLPLLDPVFDMAIFTDSLLRAIGGWQHGWRELQSRREELAKKLQAAAESLPLEFRSVEVPCYRKRFIHKGELVDLILKNEREEGITSWTTNLKYAERFKGLLRPEAVSAAIFCHVPSAKEVVVNIDALWKSKEFIAAAEEYKKKGGRNVEALFHFRDTQGEVVLQTPLRGSEVIALTGISSPFDELCDRANIPEGRRDEIFRKLIEDGTYPGEPGFTTVTGAQNVIANTIRAMNKKLGLL
jgi:hypothetical protein